METEELGIPKGRWVMSNCSKVPSEKGCKLVIMAPESQKQDLLVAAVAHAVSTHDHTDTPEFRKELENALETVEI